jgi:hypothetical protein
MRRLGIPALALFVLALIAPGCSDDDDSPLQPSSPPRAFRMGFSPFPPRPELPLLVATMDRWASRADVGLILVDPPWTALLAGEDPDSLIRGNQLGIANYLRAKGLRIVVSLDPTNGLDRSAEAPALVAAGRSLAEPEVREVFRQYATAMDTIVRPDYMGLASETNLVRAAAPAATYDAVVQAADTAAASIRAVDSVVKLYATIQVEVAWGKPGGSFVGIGQDRADFAFADAIGLSSFPFLGGFTDPDSIPLDYYAQLQSGVAAPLPLLVIEGGWPSVPAGAASASTPAMQARYIDRHARIIDAAPVVAWFQITFTDLDEAAYGFPPGSLTPFANLGLVDVNLSPKPALAAWDAVFARPRP